MYRKIVRKHSKVVVIVSSKVDKLMQENKNQNVDMVLALNYLTFYCSPIVGYVYIPWT